MKRVRWFGADWRSSFRTLATKMLANPFNASSLDGFIVDRVRENTISGRYVEKMSFQERTVDPFGEEHVADRTLYRQLEFSLARTFPNVEFLDAPRGTGGYVSRLLEFSDFTISVWPMAVDPLRWAEIFQAAIKKKMTVVSLQVSELEIESGIAAKVIISGDRDVRNAIKLVTRSKGYQLDKVQLVVFEGSTAVPIQLTSSAAVRIDETFLNDFLPALRSSLPRPSPPAS
jgi:hypothetical protein